MGEDGGREKEKGRGKGWEMRGRVGGEGEGWEGWEERWEMRRGGKGRQRRKDGKDKDETKKGR